MVLLLMSICNGSSEMDFEKDRQMSGEACYMYSLPGVSESLFG